MSKHKKMPLLINKQIIRHLVESTTSVNKRLAYLGVCQAWRQLALPFVYSTVFIREHDLAFWRIGDGWKEPDSSGHLWVVNVLSFNACDAACYAKRIDIFIHTPEGFAKVLEMLERMFNLVTCNWRHVHEFRVAFSCHPLTLNSEGVVPKLEPFVTLLLDKVPNIHKLDLNTALHGISFDQIHSKIVNVYSEVLHILKLSDNINLISSLSLKNVTILDIIFYERNAHILSCFEPQILQKLRIRNIIWSYLWKHFVTAGCDNNILDFTMLTDLYLEFTSWYPDFESDSDYSSDFEEYVDSTLMVSTALHSITRSWQTDILRRRVRFPCLQNLHVIECNYGSLFFGNCGFPSNLECLKLHTTVDLLEHSVWMMDNIAADNLIVKIDSGEECRKFKGQSVDILSNHLGHKITKLVLAVEFNLDPLAIELPMLKTLHINTIDFKTLIVLIDRLPRLRILTLHVIHFNMPIKEGSIGPIESSGRPIHNRLKPTLAQHTGNPSTTVATEAAYEAIMSVNAANLTLNSNMISLSFRFFVSEDMDSACRHIKVLIAKLSKLQVAVVNAHYVNDIKEFALEHQHIYPHFNSLIITQY